MHESDEPVEISAGVGITELGFSISLSIDGYHARPDFLKDLHSSTTALKHEMTVQLSGIPEIAGTAKMRVTDWSVGYPAGPLAHGMSEVHLEMIGVDFVSDADQEKKERAIHEASAEEIASEIADHIPSHVPNRAYLVRLAQEAALAGVRKGWALGKLTDGT